MTSLVPLRDLPPLLPHFRLHLQQAQFYPSSLWVHPCIFPDIESEHTENQFFI